MGLGVKEEGSERTGDGVITAVKTQGQVRHMGALMACLSCEVEVPAHRRKRYKILTVAACPESV